MSPASVSNFVGDLVAMATAFEKLPQVEADLAEARSTINSHLTTIQRLEAKLMDRAAELEAHLSTIRALEVARDDAQFHALEADDRTSRALDFIKATFGNAGSLIQALEPAREAVPMAVDQPKDANGVMGESADPLPTSGANASTSGSVPDATADHGPEHSAPATPTSDAPPAPEVAASPGEPLPSSASVDTHKPDAMEALSTASGSEPGGFSMQPQAKSYEGKTWTQAKAEPGFVYPDRDEWLAGGGTIDNYYA